MPTTMGDVDVDTTAEHAGRGKDGQGQRRSYRDIRRGAARDRAAGAARPLR
uniref:Uncharacterized protein n=1 Tax=Janibacter limosus TaxID=53458 RepID=A0AC61U7U1_9MICO|nr:hypothetical protein [Janibacter limosus]